MAAANNNNQNLTDALNARCNELFSKYYDQGRYKECFDGFMELAERSFPRAECQIAYFYYWGVGVNKDMELSLYWTLRSAVHGDMVAEFNMGKFYEDGNMLKKDDAMAAKWYRSSAARGYQEAIEKCKSLGL